jgi:hypothetical protein
MSGALNPLYAVPGAIVFVVLVLVPLEMVDAKNIPLWTSFLTHNLQSLLVLAVAWFVVLYFTVRRFTETFWLAERGSKLAAAHPSAADRKKTFDRKSAGQRNA